ncbi:protein-L-isoaspartate(D-aspartate) O-methyltransferase [Nonomuraea africana]|uniref:Protein-L-isoaspartate O-methyltransferase n=1 Tax=Nonomuraea africana TaxID=46171 RepID=A0ABR9KPS6_9ACTN|nr:protein-L-isoaspartate(D-aspartate) O-methyltransferase [Nonomuraea africana]MBE1564010.1 protein-L-isoaspartate(D-aspartate) O-methyltransferase [Nonomuraea africana]
MQPDRLVDVIQRTGVTDPRILAAVVATPRATFVPPQSVARAQLDEPIPIGHGQPTTQPSLIARMIDALELSGTEKVLEIGTGYGYQTALLARLARRVVSVERYADLAEHARVNLAAVGVTNAEVVVGDGTTGMPEHAPFDAVIVSASGRRVPAPLVEQLAEGGRLVMPIQQVLYETVMLYRKRHGDLTEQRMLTHAQFVPLVSEEEGDQRGGNEQVEP